MDLKARIYWLHVAWIIKGWRAKRLCIKVAFSRPSMLRSITRNVVELRRLMQEAQESK